MLRYQKVLKTEICIFELIGFAGKDEKMIIFEDI